MKPARRGRRPRRAVELPVELPAELARALGDAGLDAASRRRLTWRRLHAGVRNRVFRVRGPGLDWVVRLAGGDDAALGVARRSEHAAVQAAAGAGLAPAVVHAEQGRGVLILQFVPGDAFTWRRIRSSAGLREVAVRLRELHALAPPTQVRRANPADLLVPLRSHAARGGLFPRDALERVTAAALAELGTERVALCHLDLHYRNVLDPCRPVFVDWEYAAVADPVLDLAALASYHDLDATRRTVLRRAYGGPGAPRLDAACRWFDALQAWWYDAADAWHSLAPARRQALLGRLAAAARRPAKRRARQSGR